MNSSPLEKIMAFVAGFLLLAVLILVIGALMAFPVMWLWNGCLVGTIAGISPITSFWHAWGILILCGFLFKSSSKSSS